MDIFRSSWRTGPSSFGTQVTLDQKAPWVKKRLFLSPTMASNWGLWSKLVGWSPHWTLLLLVGTSCYTSQRLGAGGVLSPQFHPAGVSSDQAGCLRSCSGCSSCRSIKSQASAGLNDSQCGLSAKWVQPEGALSWPTPHPLFEPPITVPDGTLFSQQPLRVCHTPPGSCGNPVQQTGLERYK